MDNEFTILEDPIVGQSISTPVDQLKDARSNTINRESINITTDMNDSEIEFDNKQNGIYICRYCNLSLAQAFTIFVCAIIVIGVIIVCLTAPKPRDSICGVTFTRSAQKADAYDSRPRDIAIDDINYDGHQDIVVANAGTDNIGILLGYGNGTFTQQITYSTGTGSHPYAIAIDDVNNDTLLDIIVANYGINSIGVFLVNKYTNLTDQILTSLGASQPISIATGDFNHDQQLDVVVANYGTANIGILVGYNNGSFHIDRIYDMGYDSMPYSLLVYDVNHDNQMDIVIVNYGISQLVILLTNENGDFVKETYWTGSGSYPSSVDVGNFNNDNMIDIVVTNSGSSSIGIFLGNGNGTFQNPTTYSTGVNSYPQSLIVADFDSDTHQDIIIVDSQGNKIIGLKGNGRGEFSTGITHSTGYNSNPYAMGIGDFDNDNKPDVAVANSGTNDVLILTLFTIYPITNQTTYSTGAGSKPYYVDVADLDKDGHLDIIVANAYADNIGIFMNLGDGTFAQQRNYYMGERSQPYYTAIGDLNNDTHLDIVVVLYGPDQIGILFGDGKGYFEYRYNYSTGYKSWPYTVALGDFNRDDILDIITSNYFIGNLALFFGLGDGTFTTMTTLLDQTGYYPKCVGVGDFNNDHILDIAASNSWRTGGIAILLGYGNGSFQTPLFTSTNGDLPNCFTISDLNSDLRSDIVYTDILYSHMSVLLGSGNGTFDSLTQYLTVRGAKPWYVAVGYYDDDRFIDIAISCSYDSSINIYLGSGNGSFKQPISLSTGINSLTWSVQFGDFNNDGQEDIVAGNDGNNNIMIFFVHYTAKFLNEKRYGTGSGSHPYAVDVEDLNHDEHSDLIIANAGNNNIELLLDYNEGSFTKKTILSTGDGSHPQDVSIGDFNNDNISDIVVVNSWQSNINIFMGHENGSFDVKWMYSTGNRSAPSSITTGDLNKDNRIDIIVANEDENNIAVFLAYDYVIFSTEMIDIYGSLPNPCSVVISDFNNDNQIDLVIINENYGFDIFRGNGDGTFSERISYSLDSSSKKRTLAVADFNNDTFIDIAATDPDSGNIFIYLGYGNGSFYLQMLYSIGNSSKPTSIAVADFNNDKRSDIVAIKETSDNIWILFGFGNGSFMLKNVYSMPTNSSPRWVVADDLNNDNFADIVLTNYNTNNIRLLYGYENGRFVNAITLSTGDGSGPWYLTLGDLNKDQSLDIIVANWLSGTIGIFFGNSNGSYSSQRIYPVSPISYLYTVIVSDINNDNILDIIASDYYKPNSSFAIWYGFGNGEFTLPKIYPTAMNAYPQSIATGDFNNDRKTDLAVVYLNHQTVAIMLQTISQPFGSASLFSTGNQSHPKSVTTADFNNDNVLDIVVANYGTNNLGILFGYGNGYFSNQSTYSTGVNSLPCSVAVGYINNDSYVDIVVANYGNDNIGIFFGHSDGIFGEMITYPTGISSAPSSIVIHDLNKDNYEDIVVSNWGRNDILVYFGLGNGSLSKPDLYSVSYNSHPISIRVGDINRDGKLDIIVANYDGNYVEVFLQTC